MSKYRKFDLEAVKRGARICDGDGKEPLEYHVWSKVAQGVGVAVTVFWEGSYTSYDYDMFGFCPVFTKPLYLLPVKEKRWAIHSGDGTHIGVYCYEGDVRDWFKAPDYSITEYEIEVWK